MSNTLEELLADVLRREKNSLEILQKLFDITSSKEEKLIIEYVLADGTTQEYEIFSYAYFQQKLKEAQQNIENLAGIGARSAVIRLPDGSVRTLISSEIPLEPQPIKAITKPLFFSKKNNKILDLFLNPLPFINIDLTGKIDTTVEKIMTKKVILELDNSDDINYFNVNFNGINTTIDDMTEKLVTQGITYTEYEEIVEIPPRSARYSGVFSVMNIEREPITRTVNNEQVTTTQLIYTLNTLLYKDLQNNGSDVAIKVGDALIVNDGVTRTTKYVVNSVDSSTKKITVTRTEGYSAIIIGTDNLAIDPSFVSEVSIEVRVNINEYMIVFCKALNSNSGIINSDWGDGIGLYTSDLIDIDDQAIGTRLSSFYSTVIKDIGKNLRALQEDEPTPLTDAITPDAPTLVFDNFKVVQINTHKNDVKSTEELRQRFSDKNQIKSDIDKLDVSIKKQKEIVATSSFKNDVEKQAAQKIVDDLVSERTTKVNEFNTTIDDIISRKKDVVNYDPKYAIRGYFEQVKPKYKDPVNQIGKQEAIGYIYEYRYLKVDNTTTESQSSDFVDNDGNKTRATYSKWVRVLSKIRERAIDENGKGYWVEENTNDPDAINSNQISIPITADENVEIRVKALSEAGYPSAPAESEWSTSIIIPFPNELKDNIDFITREAEDENIRAKFLKELNSIGLNQHLLDSITIGDQYFAHDAKKIYTSFKTPENKPYSVDDVLKTHQTSIEGLNAIITGERGKISVAIVDENGTQLAKVANNDTIGLFAGYYRDIVANLPVQKGEIVTKLYYIEISNINAADLEVLSYVPGLYTERLPDVLPRVPVAFSGVYPPLTITDPDPFTETYLGYVINKDEYANYRRFWQTPISLRSVAYGSDLLEHHEDYLNNHALTVVPHTHPFIELPSFQSSQVKGQVVYARNHDITLNNLLYDQDATLANNTLLETVGSGPTRAFIWDRTQSAPTVTGNGNESDFCVHIDHPDLVATSDFMSDFANLFGTNNGYPIKSQDSSTFDIFYPQFSHSKYFNLSSDDADGLKQLNYIPYFNVSAGATINNFARKIGFATFDKYLIGKNTCGAYLFLAPPTHKSLHSGSIIYNQGYLIKQGSSYALRIPVIFQARLTDYYGSGSSGTGILGGLNAPSINNLSYAKKIGIDIAIKNDDAPLFSFDLRVEMQYKPRTVSEATSTTAVNLSA